MLSYSSKRFPALLGVIVAMPIFLQLVGVSLHLAPRNYSMSKVYNGQVIPLSTLAIVFFVFQLIRQLFDAGKSRFTRSDMAVLALATLTVCSFLVGTLFQPSLLGRRFFFLVQTLLPFIWYFVAKWAVTTPGFNPEIRLLQLMKAISHTTLFFVLLYALQTIVDGGSDYRFSAISDHIGPFFNYKIKKFWAVPLVIAAMYYLSALVSRSRNGSFLVTVGLLACSLTLALVWSRTGLLAYCVAVAAFCGAGLASRRFAAGSIFKVLGIGTLLAVLLLVTLGFINPLALERLATTIQVFDEEELLDSDFNRLQTMQQGLAVTFSSPFGGMFELVARADGLKPHGSENGYLDLSLRTGPLALIAILFLGIRSCLICWRAGAVSHRREMSTLWLASFSSIASIFLVFAVLLTVLLEPYSSAIIWTVLGAVDGCFSPKRNIPVRPLSKVRPTVSKKIQHE